MKRKTAVFIGALLFLWSLAQNPMAQAEPQPPALPLPVKKVFAHYMVCCPTVGGAATVDDYAREIQEAQKRGLDGFALNCGGWLKTEPHYKARTLQIYEAARRLGTGFQLFVSADGAALDEIPDIVRTLKNHPNQFRYNGKRVLINMTVADKSKEN